MYIVLDITKYRYFILGTMLLLALYISVDAQTNANVSVVKSSPNKDLIAIGYADGTLIVQDISSNTVVLSVQAATSKVSDLAWSPDSKMLASTNARDSMISVWNIDQARLQEILDGNMPNDGAAYVSWSPTGTFLASIAYSETNPLRIWEIRNSQFELLPLSEPFAAFDLEWRPDSNQLAIASFNGLMLYNVSSEQLSLDRNLLISPSIQLSWNPTGDLLAAITRTTYANSESQLYIVDVGTLSSRSGIFDLNSSSVTFTEWSPDGNVLAIDHVNGMVNLFDTLDWNLIATISLSRASGRNLIAWSAFGARLFVGDANLSADADISKNNLMLIPITTLDRFADIARACGAPTSLTQIDTSLQSETAIATESQALEAQLDALPEGTIPAGCEADLRAITQAIVSEQNSP
jgi:WD40 repeat protein